MISFRKKKNYKIVTLQHRYIDGHESKPANSKFSFFLFDKFEGNTFSQNVLKNLVPSCRDPKLRWHVRSLGICMATEWKT